MSERYTSGGFRVILPELCDERVLPGLTILGINDYAGRR